jgi:hypothetical protein
MKQSPERMIDVRVTFTAQPWHAHGCGLPPAPVMPAVMSNAFKP